MADETSNQPQLPTEPEDASVEDVSVEDTSVEDVAIDELQAILVMQMRIYDVMVADLRTRHPMLADSILEAHASGTLLGPLPSYVENLMEEDDEDDT